MYIYLLSVSSLKFYSFNILILVFDIVDVPSSSFCAFRYSNKNTSFCFMYSTFDIVDDFTPPEFFIIKLFFPLYLVFDTVEQYAPGFKESVVGRDILTPPDLERVFGLTGGVIVT